MSSDSDSDCDTYSNGKIIIVGDGGVGKTTYIDRITTLKFNPKYTATLGVDVRPVRFTTNCGKLLFNVWDCAGQEKFLGLDDEYYIGAVGCIIMFDGTNSFKNVVNWYNKVRNIRKTIPIVICHNIKNTEQFNTISNDNVVNVKINVKSCLNIDEPFMYLASSIMNREVHQVGEQSFKSIESNEEQ